MKRRYFLAVLCLLPSILFGQIKINEFSANKGLYDYGEEWDWIEIVNDGFVSINLANYSISDDLDDPYKWSFPDYDLASGEILTVCASGLDLMEKVDHFESFILAENVWSYFPGTFEPDVNWNQIDFNDDGWSTGIGGFGYGDGDDNTIVEGVSSVYIRKEFDIVDLQDINELIFTADYDDSYVAYLNGVEFSRSNIQGVPPAFDQFANQDLEANLYQGFYPDQVVLSFEELSDLLLGGTNVLAIQIHNNWALSSDLSANFYLSAGIESNNYYYQEIPEWINIENSNQFFHSNFKWSQDEFVCLSNQDGILESILVDDVLDSGISRGRFPDATDNWCYFSPASPNSSNNSSLCYTGVAPPPMISLSSGWYDGEQILSMSSEGGVIRYSMNGDLPTPFHPIYEEPILINNNSVVSARVFSSPGLLTSPVVDRTFVLEEDNHELPVFSIHTDSLNLWGWEEGMYIFGPNANTSDYPYFGSNFWQPWSKFSRVEYFSSDKVKLAEEELDLEIHGGWSRAEPQKSFRFDFKASYSGNIDVPFFERKPEILSFNNINIRNGGQHLADDKYQDALLSRVIENTNLDRMAYQPCLLYLNGDYWGIYGIREKIDERYLSSNYNVEPDEVDLLNKDGVLAGSDEHWQETYELIMSADPTTINFYNLLDSRIDLDNYMDYFITETFVQNLDWMGILWGINNVKLWRPQTEEGKWRYVIYDVDGALGFFGSGVEDNYINFARNPLANNQHAQIFDKVLYNPDFQCQFVNRYADLLNSTLRYENFQTESDLIKEELNDAMDDHVQRWDAPYSTEYWQTRIDDMLDYIELRGNAARNNVVESFNLNGQVDITLNVLPVGSGSIQISTIVPEDYPWDGIYFNGCPVEITAIPNPGYEFSHWTPNNIIENDTTTSSISYSLTEDDVFIANFYDPANSIQEKNPSDFVSVYPNPSQGIYTVLAHSSSQDQMKARVYDSVGKLVWESQKSNTQHELKMEVDIRDKVNGIYFLEVTFDTRKKMIRLVKN